MPPRRRPTAEIQFPELSAQLREAAEATGLSERQLAVAAGLNRATLRDALRGGNVTLETLRVVADALGLRKLKIAGMELEIGEGRSSPAAVGAAAALLQHASRGFASATGEMDKALRLLQELERESEAREHSASAENHPTR